MLYFFHFFLYQYLQSFLKEFIGIRRWSAIAFGFAGVLIVTITDEIKANFSNFEYKNLLPSF